MRTVQWFSLNSLEGKAMKKTIKMLATFAVMFMAVSTVAHAQGRGGGRPSAAAILKDSLHVSDAVAAKADSIVKAYAEKNAALRASANGDMASVMLRGVPQANGTVAPEPVMDLRPVADAVLHMASLPPDANVLFMTVMATKMPFVGRG